jgi:pimeloyl-ACP methyl ester carboxylesterase
VIEMPCAENEGVRIYYEIEGEGDTSLVLAHGGRGSLKDWRKSGYVDAFKNEFQVILFDARGHGKSDRPDEASMSMMSDDVIAVLDSTGVSEVHYWGYSMGSAVGLDLSFRYPSWFRSFIFGGISPWQWPEKMLQPIRAAYEALKGTSQPDVAILSALLNRQPLTDEELAGIDVPCLFYCGDKDPYHEGAEKAVKQIPGARFVSLPGFNHANVPAEQVIPHVREFLDKVG